MDSLVLLTELISKSATVKCLKTKVSSISPLLFAQNVSFETLYGGQFTLSTPLIIPNYLDILPH